MKSKIRTTVTLEVSIDYDKAFGESDEERVSNWQEDVKVELEDSELSHYGSVKITKIKTEIV